MKTEEYLCKLTDYPKKGEKYRCVCCGQELPTTLFTQNNSNCNSCNSIATDPPQPQRA